MAFDAPPAGRRRRRRSEHPVRGLGAVARAGAAGTRRRRAASRCTRPRDGWLDVSARRRPPGPPLPLRRSTATTTRSPIPRRAGSPTACTAPRRSSRPSFAWTDAAWRGHAARRLRASTSCTSARSPTEGTFDAAIERLDELVDLGVTAIELMPVARVPRRPELGLRRRVPVRGAVDATAAPTAARSRRRRARPRPRGRARRRLQPPRSRRQRASASTGRTSPTATARRGARPSTSTAPGSDEVRAFFVDNALQWVDDFHVDALRLDAVHAIVDPSAYPFVEQLTDAVHAARDRSRPHVT